VVVMVVAGEGRTREGAERDKRDEEFLVGHIITVPFLPVWALQVERYGRT